MLLSPFSPFPLDAFVKFAEPPDEPVANAFDASQFSAAELRVIDLAEREDAARDISSRGWLGRAVELLLGIQFRRPLADPRLESLRVFSSLARHHCDSVMDTDVTRLMEAGFSPGQVRGLLNYLTALCRTARTHPMPFRKAIDYCGPELG